MLYIVASLNLSIAQTLYLYWQEVMFFCKMFSFLFFCRKDRINDLQLSCKKIK